jgi:hypothetical protein
MCESCKLAAMLAEEIENPNPQQGRVYPKGWDLEGFETPKAFGGRTGSADDDTLRMIYKDSGLAAYHMTIAQAFSGHPMEFFRDGTFFCYRPAILKRGKPQPPAWHVMEAPEGYPEVSEQDEIRARNELEDLLRAAGVDPRDVFGDLRDDLPDEN